MRAYQFKIALKDSHPPIWRRCTIPAGLTFSQLAVLFNIIMGWEGEHLSGFSFPQQNVQVEEDTSIEADAWFAHGLAANETVIDQYVTGEKWFTYTYNYGDNWEHRVTLEQVIEDYGLNWPQVVKFKGDCPPEDSGGIYHYQYVHSEEYDPEEEGLDEEDMAFYQPKPYRMKEVNDFLEKQCFLRPEKGERRNVGQIYAGIYSSAPGLFCKPVKRKSSGKRQQMPGIPTNLINMALKRLMKNLSQELGRKTVARPLFEPLEKVLGRCKKADLVEIIAQKQANIKTTARKNVLASQLASEMLRPGLLEKYFLCMSDIEMESLGRAIHAGGIYEDTLDDDFFVLCNAQYILQTDGEALIVPLEVKEMYGKAAQGDFPHERQKRSWLLACVYVANILYGITPLDILARLYRKKDRRYRESPEELRQILQEVPPDIRDFTLDDDRVILGASEHPEESAELLDIQGDQKFYIPSYKEILAFYEDDWFVIDKPANRMLSFLLESADANEEEEEEIFSIVKEIQTMLRIGVPLEAFDEFIKKQNHILGIDDDQHPEELSFLKDMYYHTRMAIYRGFTPNEILRQRKGSAKKIVSLEQYRKTT